MGALGRIRGTHAMLIAAVAGVLTGGAGAAASAATCRAWAAQPTSGSSLTGVTLASGCAAWAVGVGSSGTFIEYWNGTAWSVQPSPDPGAGLDTLRGAAAMSGSSAWAVGDYHNNLRAFLPLILHWNGTAWTQMASPITRGISVLQAVSASSAASAWAVGEHYNTTARAYQALILHWNGTAWTRQPSGVPGSEASYLYGVVATSATSAWAVGYSATATAWPTTLILHWNGTAWTRVPSPDPGIFDELSAVTATSSTDAWAVGQYTKPGTTKTLIEHWDGTAWRQVPSPNPAGQAGSVNTLGGVAASSATNAWAVGGYNLRASPERTLAEHWDGTDWDRVPSPNPGGAAGQNVLSAVAARDSNAGAVGHYTSGGGPWHPLALRL